MIGLAALYMLAVLSVGGPVVEFQSGNEFRPDASMPRYLGGLPIENGQVFYQGKWRPVLQHFAEYGMRWDRGALVVEAYARWSGGARIVRNSGKAKVDGSDLRLSYDVCRSVRPGAPVPLFIGHMPVRWKITGLPHRRYRIFVQPHYVGLCPGVDARPIRLHQAPLPPHPASRHD